MKAFEIQPHIKRVLLAYSGGLDTSFLVAWLTKQGCEVTALTVDCGGFSAADFEELEQRARQFGAVEYKAVDSKRTLFDRVLKNLIAANVRRGGTYPLSVASERGLQAEVLAQEATAGGFDAVAHGCTGAGNDQVRFEAALAVVAQGLTVLAPVRDMAPSREEEVAWLEQNGFPLPASNKGTYSINAGLWGLTIGGGTMLSSAEPLPDDAWQWTRGGGGSARITLGFQSGVPVRVDERELDPVALIEDLNGRAGKLGVGRGYHLGDTVLGIKGRIGYEAPAAELILLAHRELEKLVLTEDQRFWKDHLGDVYGRRLHQGMLHDPLMRDLEALFASSQERVTGLVHLHCNDGHVVVEGVESPFSMMAASDAQYGERPSADADPAGALWLARVMAEPARLSKRSRELAAAGGAS